MIGIDPRLIDPQNGNYQPAPDSPAVDYGCQIFSNERRYSNSSETIIPNRYSKRRNSIEVGGSISTNTFWNADTIKVISDIQIEDDVILTISPGSIVEFQEFFSVNVLGCIKAIGESDSKIFFTSAQPTLFAIDSTFTGAWNGFIFQETVATNPTSEFTYCVFQYSKSFNNLHHGGVFYIYNNSKIEIINSIFQNNVADYGSALSIEYSSTPKIAGCIFKDNYAFISGSPIYCSYSFPQLNNNTIVSNFVLNEDTFHQAAAIQTFIAKPKIMNNIIRDNETNFFDPTQLYECKAFYTRYNNISSGYDGVGNIDEDPLFQNTGPNPLALTYNSPCIDSGSPDTTGLALPLFDISGESRISGQNIDMGAYEWQNVAISNNKLFIKKNMITNHPNPFNPSTTISFFLTTENTSLRNSTTWQAENAEIIIYNLKGQKIRTLKCIDCIDAASSQMMYSIVWDGRDEENKTVSSGVYFYQLNIDGDNIDSNKMLLVK